MAEYHIIMNRRAGTAGPEQRAIIERVLGEAGVSYQLHLTSGNPAEPAREAAGDPDCRVLVAAGGDGTVGAVADVALETGKILGVIPAGTLNHFARDLGLRTELEAAVSTVVQGRPTKIDIVRVGTRLCLNNMSLGIYPLLVRRREASQGKYGKWQSAAIEGLGLLRHPLRRIRLKLEYGGRTYKIKSPFVFIGNNDYHTPEGGFGGRTSLDSGHLTLLAYTDTSWLRMFIEIIRAFRGKPPFIGLRTAHPTEVTITGRKPTLEVAVDGEVLTTSSPLKVVLHPKALTVLRAA